MRWIAILLCLGTVGCDDQVVGASGLSLGDMFPKRPDWFFEYDNDDFEEVSYWHNAGKTRPHDEDWITFRVWIDTITNINADISADDLEPEVDDGTNWVIKLYFLDQGGPVYFQGWHANPYGSRPELGTVYYDSPGLPLALGNTIEGDTVWQGEAGDTAWTATPTRNEDDLSFNGNTFTGSWDIDVATEAGDHPFEGTWSLIGAAGLIRWDVNAFRSDLEPTSMWEYNREAAWADVLGAR